MHPSENSFRLRFYIGEEHKQGHKPLFEAIVQEARKRGLAGATVFKGFMGFGSNSRLRTTQILRLSEDLPLVVELIDSKENLLELAEHFDGALEKGLVTLEPVQVVIYRHNDD